MSKNPQRAYRKNDRLSKYFSFTILGLLIFMAVFAPLISPYNPAEQDLYSRLLPPLSEGHLLGTNYVGADTLSNIIYGSRISLTVGLLSTIAGLLIGVSLGLISGYFGGAVDTVIMRLGDIQLAFPFTLLAVALMGVLGPGVGNIIIVAVITGWVKYARIIRSEVLAAKEMEYVVACKALGFSHLRTLRHILLNVFAPALVTGTLETGRIIMLESALTFLGVGVPSNIPTWGNMLANGRTYMLSEPWQAIIPGLAILLTVLAVNMFGDWLRSYLDPKTNA